MRCLDPAVWQEFFKEINPSDMPTPNDLKLPIPLENDRDERDVVRLFKLKAIISYYDMLVTIERHSPLLE